MPKRKEGVVPRLRFPEFCNAGPWKVKKIGQISENVTAGGTPSTSVTEYWGGDIRWMNSGELNYKKVYEVQGRITENGLRNSNTKIIPKKCILIGLAGQGKTRGTVAMNMVELCINQSIAAIFPNEDVFNSDFLYHNLDNRYDELRSLSAGGEGRGGLNLQIIKSLLVPLPCLSEQQKIADCLSSLDEVIELQAKKLDAFKTHKKGLMQQLFPREGETTPRLRFPEFRDAGPWEVKRLSNTLHRISNGLTIAQVSGSCGVKVTRIETISTGRIDPNKVGYVNTDQDITQYRLRIGDILFSHINSLTHIGKSAYVDKDYNLYHGMNLLRLSVDAESNDSKFVFYLINTSIFQSSVRARANQAINQASINQTELEQSCVLIPTKKEQQKIADCLSSLDEVIELEAQKLDVLKTHKKGLMQQLFPQEVD